MEMTVLANSANEKPNKCIPGKFCKSNITVWKLSPIQLEILNRSIENQNVKLSVLI